MIKNFDKLELNRKIDVLVAYHVFGWKGIVIKEQVWTYMEEKGKYWSCCVEGQFVSVPLYTVLLTSAWDIVRKFDLCYLYRFKNINDGLWECRLTNVEEYHISESIEDSMKCYLRAETECLAICYAGLKAVKYPIEDFLLTWKEDKV